MKIGAMVSVVPGKWDKAARGGGKPSLLRSILGIPLGMGRNPTADSSPVKNSALNVASPWEQSITWDADLGMQKKLDGGGDGDAEVIQQKLNKQNVLTYRVRLPTGKETDVPWYALRNVQAGSQVRAEPATRRDELRGCCVVAAWMLRGRCVVAVRGCCMVAAWTLCGCCAWLLHGCCVIAARLLRDCCMVAA